MEKYEPGQYTEGVMQSVRVLRDQSNNSFFLFNKFIKTKSLLVIPSFAERIKTAIDTLRLKSSHDDGKVN
jgi:hypothetical protein